MLGFTDIYITKNIDDEVHETHNSFDRIGFVISQGNDSQQSISMAVSAKSISKIIVSSDD